MVLVVLALMLGSIGTASAGHLLRGSFGGEAWGTFASATAPQLHARLGRSAYLPCPCEGTRGKTLSNTVTTVDAGRPFRAEAIYTTMYATKTTTSAVIKDTAKVSKVRALADPDTNVPLISADAIIASATTKASTTTISTSSAGSSFLNLKVNGRSITTVSANTEITLPGFGYVRLREVRVSGNNYSKQITVNMVRIVITQKNELNIPVGTHIVVSHARAGFTRTQPVIALSGGAWAATARSSVATVENRIGRIAAIYVPCLGTGGRVLQNEVKLIRSPDLLLSGTAVTTAEGGATSTGRYAKTTATVEDVNLLNGTITATLVRGVAKSTYNSSTGRFSGTTLGSSFVDLKVLGRAISDNPSPNTRVDVPGVGYVILYERVPKNGTTYNSIGVNMIRLVVTTSNSFGLPAGTQIVVAHAHAVTRAFPQLGH